MLNLRSELINRSAQRNPPNSISSVCTEIKSAESELVAVLVFPFDPASVLDVLDDTFALLVGRFL